MKFDLRVSEEKIFEQCEQTTSDGRTPEHVYTINSHYEPDITGELKG